MAIRQRVSRKSCSCGSRAMDHFAGGGNGEALTHDASLTVAGFCPESMSTTRSRNCCTRSKLYITLNGTVKTGSACHHVCTLRQRHIDMLQWAIAHADVLPCCAQFQAHKRMVRLRSAYSNQFWSRGFTALSTLHVFLPWEPATTSVRPTSRSRPPLTSNSSAIGSDLLCTRIMAVDFKNWARKRLTCHMKCS